MFGVNEHVAGTWVVLHQSAHDSYWAMHQWDAKGEHNILILERAEMGDLIKTIQRLEQTAEESAKEIPSCTSS